MYRCCSSIAFRCHFIPCPVITCLSLRLSGGKIYVPVFYVFFCFQVGFLFFITSLAQTKLCCDGSDRGLCCGILLKTKLKGVKVQTEQTRCERSLNFVSFSGDVGSLYMVSTQVQKVFSLSASVLAQKSSHHPPLFYHKRKSDGF